MENRPFCPVMKMAGLFEGCFPTFLRHANVADLLLCVFFCLKRLIIEDVEVVDGPTLMVGI